MIIKYFIIFFMLVCFKITNKQQSSYKILPFCKKLRIILISHIVQWENSTSCHIIRHPFETRSCVAFWIWMDISYVSSCSFLFKLMYHLPLFPRLLYTIFQCSLIHCFYSCRNHSYLYLYYLCSLWSRRSCYLIK